jgi:ATP-binding cassette subfamily C (CFTR/MRP) protein 1
VQVNADFTWETALGEKNEKGKADEKSGENNNEVKSKKKSMETKSQNLLPFTIDDSQITEEEEPPFSFRDLRFEVPKGAFVAIVGRVGCGKVSRES